MKAGWKRWVIGCLSALLLVIVFVFPARNLAQSLGIDSKDAAFMVNKTVRFVVNDLLMIGVIYALFGKRQYVWFAVVVQVAGIVLLLIPYFVIKLYFHASNGPLVSFLHRLVLNPTLMLLLIPALWLQQQNDKSSAGSRS